MESNIRCVNALLVPVFHFTNLVQFPPPLKTAFLTSNLSPIHAMLPYWVNIWLGPAMLLEPSRFGLGQTSYVYCLGRFNGRKAGFE